jgi:hypothetical protein
MTAGKVGHPSFRRKPESESPGPDSGRATCPNDDFLLLSRVLHSPIIYIESSKLMIRKSDRNDGFVKAQMQGAQQMDFLRDHQD